MHFLCPQVTKYSYGAVLTCLSPLVPTNFAVDGLCMSTKNQVSNPTVPPASANPSIQHIFITANLASIVLFSSPDKNAFCSTSLIGVLCHCLKTPGPPGPNEPYFVPGNAHFLCEVKSIDQCGLNAL